MTTRKKPLASPTSQSYLAAPNIVESTPFVLVILIIWLCSKTPALYFKTIASRPIWEGFRWVYDSADLDWEPSFFVYIGCPSSPHLCASFCFIQITKHALPVVLVRAGVDNGQAVSTVRRSIHIQPIWVGFCRDFDLSSIRRLGFFSVLRVTSWSFHSHRCSQSI